MRRALVALALAALAACGGPCNDSKRATGGECPCALIGSKASGFECREVCAAEHGSPALCGWVDLEGEAP